MELVIGVLLFSTKYNMICCMAVSPDYRKQGIGSLLPFQPLEKMMNWELHQELFMKNLALYQMN